MKNLETLLKDYADHVAERAAKGIPPLPLNAEQTNCITKLLEQDSTYDSSYLLDFLLLQLIFDDQYECHQNYLLLQQYPRQLIQQNY